MSDVSIRRALPPLAYDVAQEFAKCATAFAKANGIEGYIARIGTIDIFDGIAVMASAVLPKSLGPTVAAATLHAKRVFKGLLLPDQGKTQVTGLLLPDQGRSVTTGLLLPDHGKSPSLGLKSPPELPYP